MSVREKILSRFDKLDNLPVFPETAHKLIAALQDPNSSAGDIAQLVKYDVSISAAILKMANSAYYNPSGHLIGNIKQAVARLGMEEIRKIGMSFGAMKTFVKTSELIDLKAFWKHSIGVAMCTRIMVARLGGGQQQMKDAFSAGLFHDIGVLVLDQFFHFDYLRVRKNANHDNRSVFSVENEKLGIHHGEIGSRLLAKWRFPAFISEASAFHHNPDCCGEEHKRLCQIVHLADFAVSSSGEFEPGEGMPEGFSQGTWFDLGIQMDELPDIIEETEKEIEGAKALALLGIN